MADRMRQARIALDHQLDKLEDLEDDLEDYLFEYERDNNEHKNKSR